MGDLQGALRGEGTGLRLQAQAQRPIEKQWQEADQGVGPDGIRQAVEERRDLGLKGTKPSALLSGEGFVFWGAWR